MDITGMEVTIKMTDFQELTQKLQAQEKEIARLRVSVVEASKAGITATLEEAVDAIRATLPIISFAVANLHYDDIRGWPWAALETYATYVATMPGATEADKEWAEDVRSFAGGAAARETERKHRKPGDKPMPTMHGDRVPPNR